MQTPIVVSFHNLPPSPALEAAAQAEAATLASVFDRIVSCRVAIEAPHQRSHKGEVYRVRIDLGVPGKHIVVGRAPGDHPEHTDAHLALRDAFDAARRQLLAHAERSRGRAQARAGSAIG
jgi:ribosome-associated translation inhibitor RaiA